MSEPHNPPAFPVAAVGPSGDLFHIEGLTMRDWFASQWIVGAGIIVEKGESTPNAYARLAEQAYEIADAMLRRRDG